MKKIIGLILCIAFPVSQAQEAVPVSPTISNEINWDLLDNQPLHIEADDPAVQSVLEERFADNLDTDAEPTYTLKAKSFYRLVYEHQQGYPGKIIKISDVLGGEEPDRFKLNFLACGKQDNTVGKHEAWNVGMNTGVSAASTLASNMSAAGLTGVGIVVGLLAAVFTSGETELSCTETKTVCPFSASWCEWKESVITQFTLIQDDQPIAASHQITDRVGRGFKAKDMVDKHLLELAQE